MADSVFNLQTGQKAERKLLITCVDVGTTDNTEDWEVIGVGIEESSVEYNPDMTTTTDIIGNTSTVINKLEPKQTMEPYTVTGGSKLAVKLYDLIKYNKLSELSMFKVMLIHAYVGATDKYDAEVHSGCTIIVNSLGGSSYLDMPIEINFSNNKKHGTVNDYKVGTTITFTETTVTPPTL